VAVGCQPVNLVPRDLLDLAEPALEGLDGALDLFGTEAPVDPANSPVNAEGLPVGFGDMPLNLAGDPAFPDAGEMPVDPLSILDAFF
jgi:hypothetical protein